MTSSDIQEGDDVSWNYGTGHPSGTVAEVKTDGQLEIETKGKLVHKNASPSNPAVHVARQGNDVVKRASELTKESSTEGDDESQSSEPVINVEENKEDQHGVASDPDAEIEESSPKPEVIAEGEKRKRAEAEEEGTSVATEVPSPKKARKASGKGAKKAGVGEKKKRVSKQGSAASLTTGDQKMESDVHVEKGNNSKSKGKDSRTKKLPNSVPAAGTRSRDH